MNKPVSSAAGVSSLRQRLIDDMNVRRFSPETQRNYIRDVRRFATFVGRPPDTATSLATPGGGAPPLSRSYLGPATRPPARDRCKCAPGCAVRGAPK
jgi:Phage integrase, N-terminal SAM-like domain